MGPSPPRGSGPFRVPAGGPEGGPRHAMLPLTCDKGAQRTHKEVRDLIRRLREQAFEVVDKGVAHPKVYKDGQLLTTLLSTPSDVRSLEERRRQTPSPRVSGIREMVAMDYLVDITVKAGEVARDEDIGDRLLTVLESQGAAVGGGVPGREHQGGPHDPLARRRP